MEVQRFLVTITWSFIVQTLKILTDAYISRIVRGQSRLKDVIERYFWNGLSRERLKAMKALYALYALYAKYANVLVEKRTLVEKSKIWNLKPNCIYYMQSIEQYYYRETEEQNCNGCKLLVKLATKYRNGSDLWLDDKNRKVNKLYLNSLLMSIVNRVSRSGKMKYQSENTDESNKKWLLT